MATVPLHIQLLGGFALFHGDVPVALESSRAQSLLCYLVIHRRLPQQRQHIAFRFWPDSSEKQAQTNLRNLLHHLRAALPALDLYLEVGARSLALRFDAPVLADVVEFEEAAERVGKGTGAAAIACLEAAIRVYRGDLLPGCYDEWLLPEQDRLRKRYATMLEGLLTLHEEAGNFQQAIAAAEQVVRNDPLHEAAHRRLIAAHAARGDRARAVRAYHNCVAILERDLGVAPSAATLAAYESALGLAEAPSDHRTSPASRSLIGRNQAWTTLLDVWQATITTHARLVLVSGEAGIGKTRLVEELIHWLKRQGVPVAHARSYAAEGALAYAPIIEWLRSPAFNAAMTRLPPPVRTELSRLLPELGRAGIAVSTAESLSDAERRQRIQDAVVLALQTSDSPAALIAEDLHWSDRSTLELLHALVRRSARPLLVVGTLRAEEVDDGQHLPAVASGLAAMGRLVEIELNRLDARDTAALAEQSVGRSLSALEGDALYRETEGNPLFVIETLRTGWSPESVPRTSPRVQAVIETRLMQLSPDARHLAEVAATIGREFTLNLLVNTCASDVESPLHALDELWRRRIIRERGGDAYDFSHDRIREVAYLRVSPLRRREHHLRVARALEVLHGEEATAHSGQIAWHYDLGGAADQAVVWHARAAAAARHVGALETVARLLRRALDLLQTLPATRERDARELEMRLALAAALVALEGYAAPESGELYQRARSLCQRLNLQLAPPVLRGLALAAVAHSDFVAAEAFGHQLVDAGERECDDLAAVEGRYVLGVVAIWRGQLGAARTYLESAIASYKPERHREHVALYAQDPNVICHIRLAHTLWHLGLPAQAMLTRDRAIALALTWADPLSCAYALWWSVFIDIDAEDWPRLRTDLTEMQRLADEHGLLYIAAVVESFAGFRDTLAGDVAGGITRMKKALSDPRAAGQESVLRPQTLTLLARAHAAAGHLTEGLDAVAACLSFTARGAHIWDSELHRLRAGLLIAARASEHDIEVVFADALATARTHQSAWIELRTAIDLTRWRRAHGTAAQLLDSRATLERAAAHFVEGSHVTALVEAKLLLREPVTD